MKSDRIADIQYIEDAFQPQLKVIVPKGTTFEETVKLRPILSELLGKLRGCPACNSGVPIWFQEREDIAQLVRVDLDRMQLVV